MSDELPKGWVWAKMLDILDYEGGSQPPKKEFIYEPRDGYVRLMQIRDFGDKPFPTYVPDSKRLKKATRDDLLLARYGGSSGSDSLGRVCTGLDGAYNVALAKLIFSRDTLEKDYVRYLFLGPWFREKVSQNSRSCQTGFNREDVEDIAFPIAPLPEQRRIVEKLETLLGKLDASQQRLAKIQVLLKRFRHSVLAAACSGRLTADWREENENIQAADSLIKNAQFQIAESEDDLPELPEKWRWVALGNYAHCFRGRFSPRPRNDPRYFNGPHPFIQIGNLPHEGGLVNSHVQTLNDEGLAVSRKFPKGTVVIAIVGATIGNTGVLAYDMCVTDSIVGLETGDELGNRYVELFLRNKKEAIRQSSYSSGGQPNINLAALNPYPLALPPLPEQQEIVRRVERLFALADQLELRLANARGQMDKLTPSLLARAFAGKLVPQDPNDEPATILLERIRGRHNGNETEPKRQSNEARDKTQSRNDR